MQESNIPSSAPSPVTLVQISGLHPAVAGQLWKEAVRAERDANFFDGAEFVGSTAPVDAGLVKWLNRLP